MVRNYFDNRLPHPKTIASWLKQSDVNGEPGIRDETLRRLAGFVKELKNSTGEDLICSLIFDEMHIKKQVYWDQSKFEYTGYPTYPSHASKCDDVNKNERNHEPKKGNCFNEATEANMNEKHQQVRQEAGTSSTSHQNNTRTSRCVNRAKKSPEKTNKTAKKSRKSKRILRNTRIGTTGTTGTTEASNKIKELFINENDTEKEEKNIKKKIKSPLATRAIVFMLCGLNKCFEFSVGYHLVNGLGGEALSELVNEVIMKVSGCGVKIANMTFDGAKDNIKMCEIMGANLDPLSVDFRPFINNPFDGSTIFLIFDPSHMEKLMRNLLGNHGILFDENNDQIEWKYFVELQEISKSGNLLTHKLTKKHTKEFKRNKMNVRLAVETYSTSVADSFKILRENGHSEFKNSFATEKFTRMMDTMFDVTNSRDTRHSNVYKRPLSSKNKKEVFQFIEESKIKLKSLRMNVVRRKDGIETRVKQNVLKTLNKTPVLGFLVNLTNIPQMFTQFVEQDEQDENDSPLKKTKKTKRTKPMKHFRTYAMSQDRIEFFLEK